VDKFKEGHAKRGGRKAGTPNRFTSLKQSFLDAFEMTGGTAGLAAWIAKSERNRTAFYQLVTRLFPQEVNHGVETKG
jgi:hypothetical protein